MSMAEYSDWLGSPSQSWAIS